MTEKAVIKKVNNTHAKIFTDEGTLAALRYKFTFDTPNMEFDPKVKKRLWDGKIRLVWKNGLFYVGLLKNVVDFLNQINVSVELIDLEEKSIKPKESLAFINKIKDEIKYAGYEHQLKGFQIALLKRRCVIVSPTASGKSLMQFLIIKYILSTLKPKEKILLVVPTTSLVYQMQKDFIDYDNTNLIEDYIHCILSGKDKDANKQIYISTWQSIYDRKASYFKKFKCVIFDECHQVRKATSLTSIAEKCTNAEWCFGCTGTLDEFEAHHYIIRGLLGDIYRVAYTKDLIDKGILSKLKIVNIILDHPMEEKRIVSFTNYMGEIKYIVNHKKRNSFIAKFASTRDKNVLVLFARKASGQEIYKKLCKLCKGKKKVHYIDGDTPTEIREDIRESCELDDYNVIVASVQVFSVGINIKRLHCIILGHPFKGKIRTLQSIGRGLRTSKHKEILKVYDIVDDFSYHNGKEKRENYGLKHFKRRRAMYRKEEFNFVDKRVRL